jgi:hypothetical protein
VIAAVTSCPQAGLTAKNVANRVANNVRAIIENAFDCVISVSFSSLLLA